MLLLRANADMAQPPLGSDGGSTPWPPPLPPPHCVMRFQGDSQTCQSADTWRLSASFDCESLPAPGGTVTGPDPGPMMPPPTTTMATGMRLGALDFFGACGGSTDLFLGIRYLCCPVVTSTTRTGMGRRADGGQGTGQGIGPNEGMKDGFDVSARSPKRNVAAKPQ